MTSTVNSTTALIPTTGLRLELDDVRLDYGGDAWWTDST
ncbi:hypothetical protein W823_24340 [Williamsia sp. D3]|nr:hypothetical protein W823_24340 [Williamsia sp. D3]